MPDFDVLLELGFAGGSEDRFGIDVGRKVAVGEHGAVGPGVALSALDFDLTCSSAQVELK